MIDSFLKFEDKHDLLDMEIAKVKVWHLCRFQVYNEILKQKENMGEAHANLTNMSKTKILLMKIKQIPNYVFFNPLCFLQQKDMLVINHQRRVKIDSKYNCLYTDQWIEDISSSYYVFEEPMLERHYRPIPTKHIRYTDYITFMFSLSKRFKKFNISHSEKNIIKKLIQDINKRFSVHINYNIWTKKITDIIHIYKYRYNKIEKILKKVRPKVIVEVVSYSPTRMAFTAAAKKIGIPVVELQHGVIGSKAVAYNFQNRRELNMFPDYLFSFGQFWKDSARFPIDDANIKVVGWPFYENKINQFEQEKLENKKNILFLSQGTVGEGLSKVAVDLNKLIDKTKYNIIYKLHPGEYSRWKEEYPNLIDSGVQVIDNNQYDMHHYFAKSDIQVGVYSTTLFEGLGYRLETYICRLFGYEYVEDLYKGRIAEIFDTAEELKEMIYKDKKGNQIDIEYFWAKDSKNKIIKYINTILVNGRIDE